METLEIAFVLVSFIAIAESVLLIWISQSYKTLIKRALGAAEGAVDTGEEILAEYRRTTDLNLAALAYIKALEHELAGTGHPLPMTERNKLEQAVRAWQRAHHGDGERVWIPPDITKDRLN